MKISHDLVIPFYQILMKRRGSKIIEQPVAKKPDLNASTDLRSKISAKLQTLLNGITTDSDLFIRSRRELYGDLFREPQYPEIVIDPTIVVKIEDANDSEQSSDAVVQLPTTNFLSSAKTRITELLNKRQDCEKENSLSSNENIPGTSSKSRTSQSITSNTSKARTRNSSISESSNSSHPDVLISQGQLQNVCVVVEDIMKSKTQTQLNSLISDQSKKNQTSTSSQKSHRNRDKNKRTIIKDNEIISDKTINSHESCSDVEVCIIDTNVANTPESYSATNSDSHVQYFNISETSNLSICDMSHEVLNLGDNLVKSNITNQNISSIGDDSEVIDNSEIISCPEVIFSVGEMIEPYSIPGCIEPNPQNNNYDPNISYDPDIVVLCEKRPTCEVITLEEDKDSGDIIEEIQKCFQCGKTFRAKSLLNFHLRMHGSLLNASPSSSSIQSSSYSSQVTS